MYIYVLFNKLTGLTKIGITDDIDRRVKQLENQTGCELNIIAWAILFCAPELEKLLHSMFRNKRAQGEWFNFVFYEARALMFIWVDFINSFNQTFNTKAKLPLHTCDGKIPFDILTYCHYFDKELPDYNGYKLNDK